MAKRLLISAVVVIFLASLGFASAKQEASKGKTYTGWVTDTACGEKGANAKHTECANKCVKEKGAKYALYDSASKKTYVLDPQDQAADHAGHHVKVTGTLEGDTLHVSNITMADEKGMK